MATKKERKVVTGSAARDHFFTASLELWRIYHQHLCPLLDNRDVSEIDWDNGEDFDRLRRAFNTLLMHFHKRFYGSILGEDCRRHKKDITRWKRKKRRRKQIAESN